MSSLKRTSAITTARACEQHMTYPLIKIIVTMPAVAVTVAVVALLLRGWLILGRKMMAFLRIRLGKPWPPCLEAISGRWVTEPDSHFVMTTTTAAGFVHAGWLPWIRVGAGRRKGSREESGDGEDGEFHRALTVVDAGVAFDEQGMRGGL
jgi:hypothetical protein